MANDVRIRATLDDKVSGKLDKLMAPYCDPLYLGMIEVEYQGLGAPYQFTNDKGEISTVRAHQWEVIRSRSEAQTLALAAPAEQRAIGHEGSQLPAPVDESLPAFDPEQV